MSMNREEAINRIENHMEVHGIGEYPHIALKEALDMAITALRPVSREQVEKVWRGEWERITDPYGKLEGFLCKCGTQTYSASNFCPACGRAMTDEAVGIMLERWREALGDEVRDVWGNL